MLRPDHGGSLCLCPGIQTGGKDRGTASRRHPPFRAYSPAFMEVRPGIRRRGPQTGRIPSSGKSEHDQYYLMTYRPKAGRAAAGDRGGKPVIVRPGDRIGMTGSTDAIYYCRLGGGIYDEPMLSSLLAVDDSLGRVRGRYLENAREASERNDTATSREWGGKFNRFYNGNPGVERKDIFAQSLRSGQSARKPVPVDRQDTQVVVHPGQGGAQVLQDIVRRVENELFRPDVRRLHGKNGTTRRRKTGAGFHTGNDRRPYCRQG